MTTPAVAVVVATFGRDAALRCALESAVRQTFTDWELLVVGDACRDGTAGVVDSLADRRVRFVNLPVNIGEQSGPNNVGIALTSAPLVAFLNHDDLWFPDHLDVAVAALHARAADLVFSPNLNVLPRDSVESPLHVIVDGLSWRGAFDVRQIDRATVASSWVVRRQALERLRGWRSAAECVLEPSQDLLWRAHRAGLRLRSTGVPTVISIASGIRPGSYVGDLAAEQAHFLRRLNDPALQLELLARDNASTGPDRRLDLPRRRRWWFSAIRPLAHVGVSPRVVDVVMRRRLRRGELLGRLRDVRGLDRRSTAGTSASGLRREAVLAACTVPARDEPIDFAEGGTGVRFCAAGWSVAEPWGVWSDGPVAELALRTAGGTWLDAVLELTVHPHLGSRHRCQRVEVDAAGQRTRLTLTEPAPGVVRIAIGMLSAEPTIVRFGLPDAWRPPTNDRRRLAIGLHQAVVR